MTNITVATFAEGVKVVQTEPLHQYDYGQILRFVGIDDAMDSSDNYEVHFSNNDLSGSAKSVVGGTSGVIIPDEYLASGADIHAWVYTHTGASDQDEEYTDGRTSYEVIIPVLKRARPSDMPPTPTGRDTIVGEIQELQGDVHDINESINGITGDIGDINTDVSGLTTRVTTAESNISTLTTATTLQDVKNSITFTAGQNCDSSITGTHPTSAYVSAGVLYMKFSVKPSADLSSNTNVDIRYTGFTPKLGGDWRVGFAVIGVGIYMAWTATQDGYPVIRCRYMNSNGWTATTSPIFTAVIPLA